MGLTAQKVRKSFNIEEPEHTPKADNAQDPETNYIFTFEMQQFISRLLEANIDVIIALSICDVPADQIAQLFGVSRESIGKRLRAFGVSRRPGFPKKPIQDQKVSIRLRGRAIVPVSHCEEPQLGEPLAFAPSH